MSALCMLDLSAAFDSVDHELLLRRLEFRFGFTRDVLEWIKSYLTNRTFTVICQVSSDSAGSTESDTSFLPSTPSDLLSVSCKSELLCFMQQKCKLLTADHLLNQITSRYDLVTAIEVRTQLEKVVSS